MSAEWHRTGGLGGHGDKVVIDSQIEVQLRLDLLNRLDCDVRAEEQTRLMCNGQTVHAPRGQLMLAPGTELCATADFISMPSVAYRLARAAAGDALVGTSLVPVSAHDVV